MKLTPAAIADIRARRAAGEKLLSIALDYGVSEVCISQAARGVTHTGRRPGRPRKAVA